MASETVNAAPTVTLSSSLPSGSTYGQPVTFTAAVAGGSPAPAGTVTFYANGASLGNGTISSGQATYATALLPVTLAAGLLAAAGKGYLWGALVLGVAFLGCAMLFAWNRSAAAVTSPCAWPCPHSPAPTRRPRSAAWPTTC